MRLILILFLAGCHLQPRPGGIGKLKVGRPGTFSECATFDHAAFGWSVASVLFGALGTAGAGFSLSFDDPVVKDSVGGVSAGVSILGPVGALISGYYAKQYTDRCTTNTGGQ